MSALNTQVEGTHYKNVKIQPIELAYMLGASPALCKLMKYLSRDKNDKKINLQKAVHCIQLEQELFKKYKSYEESAEYALTQSYTPDWINSVNEFSNQFTKSEAFSRAIISMYRTDYNSAIAYVKEYASELGIDL